MKLIYTSIVVMLATISYSQGIEIFKVGESVDISGTEVVVVDGSGSQSEMYQSLDLINTTGATLNLDVVRVKLDEMAGGVEDYLCWGSGGVNGACYSASIVSGQDPYTSGDTYPFSTTLVSEALKAYYIPNGIQGTTKYRYYIVDNDTQVKRDSVDVTFTNVLSVEEDVLSFSVYPNPVNDVLNINMTGSNTAIKIYDIVGKEVASMNLVNGNNQLNIESLKSGVYFYSIMKNGDLIETKKIVVR